MGDCNDTLGLTILYDVARSLLAIRAREEVLGNTLLSLQGICAAREVVYFQREEDRFARRCLRSAPGAEDPACSLPARPVEAVLLREPRVLGGRFDRLGSAAARCLRKLGTQLLVGLRVDDQIDGIFAIGPRLLSDPYTEREAELAGGIVELASIALSSSAGPRGRMAGGGARRSKVEAMRSRHPALAVFRGDGPSTCALFEELISLADLDLPVLIQGETGTGKELVARALHDLSARRCHPFEAINCPAIPRELMASALFGHERGAFTGAVSGVRGAFERAGDGTVFLDEIGDMPADSQATLLRVLQERSFHRVGGEKGIPVRSRIVSATNRHLIQDVKAGRFRGDLFYRLQMYTVCIPPLRERREDIPALVAELISRHRRPGRPVPKAGASFLRALDRYELPGNVRELESLVVAALLRARGDELAAEHLPPCLEEQGSGGSMQASSLAGVIDPAAAAPSYAEMEREYIRSILRLTEGNRSRAAELMRIPRTTLNARIRKLGIPLP